LLVLLLPILLACTPAFGLDLIWPTPNPAFLGGEPFERFIQPTASGDVMSGTFGAVRSGGRQFHEGIDLAPALKRTRRGEATDPVYAAMPGRVVHVSRVAGRSSYGRYVVIEHEVDSITLYTLYAHLASVADDLGVGMEVESGRVLGVLGRSASGYTIPRDRAHLHFEIGLRLGSRFDSWYARQKFESPNFHGNFNGMNLCGFDPLEFYRDYVAGEVPDMAVYVRSLPTGYVLRVCTDEVPDFIRRNTGLLSSPLPEDGVAGWDIAFTWFGLPKQWTPLRAADLGAADKPGVIRVRAINRELIAANRSRNTVRIRDGKPVLCDDAMDSLDMIFGHKMR
jgi:murein DD-endopeptidase MepM/ murein hydrolase activator NlpD